MNLYRRMVRQGYHKITGHQTNKNSQSSLGDSAEVMDLADAMRDVHSSHEMSANKGDFHGKEARGTSRNNLLTPVLVGTALLLLASVYRRCLSPQRCAVSGLLS